MISHILRQVRRFTETHGYRPNTLFISPAHCAALEQICPGILSEAPPIKLGLGVKLMSDCTHPQVGFVRPNPEWEKRWLGTTPQRVAL